MNRKMSKIKVRLTEDPEDSRFGELLAEDGEGGTLTGEVATGPLIAERFKMPWPEHPRGVLLRSLDAPTAWLFTLKIPPGGRSRGRGTELLTSALMLLRDRGVRYVVLAPRPETVDDRARLFEFYERLGFERQGDYMVADLDRLRTEG